MIDLTNCGSFNDIKSSLKNAESRMSISDFEKNIEAEKKFRKRASVVKLFDSAIKRRQKAKSN